MTVQVLSFNVYFEEEVGEPSKPQKRVRKLVLCYFLEDGSIQMTEPRETNSGIVQART
jgi:hypothetical protein